MLVLVLKQKQDIGLARNGNLMAYKKSSVKKSAGKAKLTAKQMKLPKALRDKILAAKRKGK